LRSGCPCQSVGIMIRVRFGCPPKWMPIRSKISRSCQSAVGQIVEIVGTSGATPKPSADSPHSVTSVLMPISSWTTMVTFLLSHVFHEFPCVKLALSEGGVGWIPAALERADYIWQQHRHSRSDLHMTVPPSQLYRSNVYGCLLDDTVGMELRHRIDVGHIMFESDYPHADSKWPYSRQYAADLLVDVPDDEAHRMIELNARELFHFPRAPQPSASAQGLKLATT